MEISLENLYVDIGAQIKLSTHLISLSLEFLYVPLSSLLLLKSVFKLSEEYKKAANF